MQQSIIDYNKDTWEELVFSLKERYKSAIVMAIFDTSFAQTEIIKAIKTEFAEYKTHLINLPANSIESLGDYIKNNISADIKKTEKIQHFIHIKGLEKHIFTHKNGELTPTPLANRLNMEREILFRNIPAILFFSIDKEAANILSRQAPDFWDWLAYILYFSTPKQIITPFKEYEAKNIGLNVPDYDKKREKNIENLLEQLSLTNRNLQKKRLLKTERNIRESLAIDYYHLGKFDNSIIELDLALQLSNNLEIKENDNLYFYLGLNYSFKEEYGNSIKALTELTKNHTKKEEYKNILETYLLLGIAYYNKKDYDKAIESYKKAVEIKPDKDEAWYNLGIAYKNKKDYDKAIESYKKAVEIKPDDDSAWNNLGSAYANKKDYDKAIESYKKAIEIKPDKDEAWYNLGIAYYDKKDYAKAIESYKKAIEIKPDKDEAWNNLGVAYYNKKDYDKAIESYKKAVEINEKSGALTNLGWLYFTQNEKKLAKKYFSKNVKLNKEHSAALMNLGHIELTEGNKEKALQLYKKSVAMFSNKEDFFTGFKDDWQYMETYKVNKDLYFNILQDLEEKH